MAFGLVASFNPREKRASQVAEDCRRGLPEVPETGLERGKQEVLVRFESVLRLQVATLHFCNLRSANGGGVFAVASGLPFLLQSWWWPVTLAKSGLKSAPANTAKSGASPRTLLASFWRFLGWAVGLLETQHAERGG